MDEQRRVLVWFRNDLRVQDHQPLHAAIQTQLPVLAVYCFDPHQFGQTGFGFAKTGAFRAQFLLESVADLRTSLQALGGDLVVRCGQPEQVLPAIAAEYGVTALFYHTEITQEERVVEQHLQSAMTRQNVAVHSFWGSTLYHPQDLPLAIAEIPDLFTTFRKAVEAHGIVRPLFPTPRSLPALPPALEPGNLPTLQQLGLETPTLDERRILHFAGGESAGQARAEDYIWTRDGLRTYKQTRNGMLRADDSSKLSPWLALGCLSPRWVYHQVKTYEAQRVANDSTYWLIFELLWRDYFRWIAAKYGDRLFYRSGLQGLAIPWQDDPAQFAAWQQGRTGYPLVDANMRELAATGFMSNRGRQNVASFLTKNLGLNWVKGAEWFESQLIDYDVCSNWGNWNYTAGVGNDARGFRFFNILKQSQDYDPQGHYVKRWLPELAALPESKVHKPWTLLPVEQTRWRVQLDVDYPAPIVDLFQSATQQETIYRAAQQKKSSCFQGGQIRSKS